MPNRISCLPPAAKKFSCRSPEKEGGMSSIYKKVKDALESIKSILAPREERQEVAHGKLRSRFSTSEPLAPKELEDIKGLCKDIAEPSCHERIESRFGILKDIAEKRSSCVNKRISRKMSIGEQLGRRLKRERVDGVEASGYSKAKRQKNGRPREAEDMSRSQSSAGGKKKIVQKENDVSWGVLPKRYWISSKTEYAILEKALASEDKNENLYLHLGEISTDEEELYFSEENVRMFNSLEVPKKCKFGDGQYNCRDCMEYEIRQEYERREKINNRRAEQEAKKRREESRRRWEEKMPKSFLYLERKMGGNMLLARYFTDEQFSMDDLDDSEKEELSRMLIQKRRPELFDIDLIEKQRKVDEDRTRMEIAKKEEPGLKAPEAGIEEPEQEAFETKEDIVEGQLGRDIEETPIFPLDRAKRMAQVSPSLPAGNDDAKTSKIIPFPLGQPQSPFQLRPSVSEQPKPFAFGEAKPELLSFAPKVEPPQEEAVPPAPRPFSFGTSHEAPVFHSLSKPGALSTTNGLHLRNEPFLFRKPVSNSPRLNSTEEPATSPLQSNLGSTADRPVSFQSLQHGAARLSGTPPGKRKLGPANEETQGAENGGHDTSQEQAQTISSATIPFSPTMAPPSSPQPFGFIVPPGSAKNNASYAFSGENQLPTTIPRVEGFGNTSFAQLSSISPFPAKSSSALGGSFDAWAPTDSVRFGSGKSLLGGLVGDKRESSQPPKPTVEYLSQDNENKSDLGSLLGGKNIFGGSDNDPFVRKNRPGSRR
jgi:hypothetical protein